VISGNLTSVSNLVRPLVSPLRTWPFLAPFDISDLGPELKTSPLDSAIVQLIQPPLTELKFRIEARPIAPADGAEVRAPDYTLINNDRVNRVVMQLPDSVLTNYTDRFRRSLRDVRDVLQRMYKKNWELFICHDSKPHETYIAIVEDQWPEIFEVRSSFLPVEKLTQASALSGDGLHAFLRDTFRLDVQGAAAALQHFDSMTRSELDALCKMLARLENWSSTGLRVTMLDNAGLQDYRIDVVGLDGAPKDAARAVIFTLSGPQLARLLNALKKLGGLGREEQALVDSILDTYELK